MKKRVISLVTAVCITFSLISPNFVFSKSQNSQENSNYKSVTKSADLKASIIFTYPEKLDNFDNKNTSLNLKLNNSEILTIPVTKSILNTTSTYKGYSVEITPVIEKGFVHELEVIIHGLSRQGGYSLTFTANGHKTHTTTGIDLTKSSHKVIVKTNTDSFTIGDVNNDKVVNSKDVSVLEKNINTKTANRDQDLNGDGIVDITDIALVNHHINAKGTQVSGAYEYFTEEVVSSEKSEKLLKEASVTLTGNLSDLSSGDKIVTLTSDKDISKESPLQIPLVLGETIEMDAIELNMASSTTIENGYVVIETKDGSEILAPFTKSASSARSKSSSITVSLGGKVSVKKATISITDVYNSNGSKKAVSLKEVKFLQDIEKQERVLELATVTDLKAVTSVNSVNLSWGSVPNATGYKIYYGTSSTALNKVLVVDKTSATINDLENGTTYYFSVSATADNNESAKSKVVSAVIKNVTKPTKPENLKVTSTKDLTAEISWQAVENATSYKVYYKKESVSSYTLSTTVSTTSAVVKLPENNTTYDIYVTAVNSAGESDASTSVKATIANTTPITKPTKPENLKVIAEYDLTAEISWQAVENATSYKVYYKKESVSSYTLSTTVSTTSAVVKLPENNTTYDIYVTAVNSAGESYASTSIKATPRSTGITPPTLPTENKISNSNIESVKLYDNNFYDSTLYPNGFKAEWVIDENYNTSWVARSFVDTNEFHFVFKDPITSDYVIQVPRLDGNYRNAINSYNIKFWYDGDNLNGNASYSYNATLTNTAKDKSYLVLNFPKQKNIKKMAIATYVNNPSINVSASEFVFYSYNDIEDRVANLFIDGTFTQLNNGVNSEKIDALEKEINNINPLIINKEQLLKVIEAARNLLNKDTSNDTSVIGIIKDNFKSIDKQKDYEKYDVGISDFQPLGITAKAGEEIVIYAEIPEGEVVTVTATQYYANYYGLTSGEIKLKKGRNVISVPKIGNLDLSYSGGPLYASYSGSNPSKVKLNIIGGTKIPYLELNDRSLSEAEIKNRVSTFIGEVEKLVPTLSTPLDTNFLNHVEISLPDVLLSLPADKVLEGINSAAGGANVSRDVKVQGFLTNKEAWEETIKIIYRTYGIDDHINNGLQSRQNIRYMRMFTGAFMYAAKDHIGIGITSVAELMKGKPVSTLSSGATSNQLFTWGIAHEIGHVLDKLGIAEITNNIYSLYVQTYDGKNNTLTSRLETSDSYMSAYQHVSSGKQSLPEKVPDNYFLSLVMYWQLHLAYDGPNDNFYNKLYKKFRETDSTLNGLNYIEKFAVLASKTAEKDLTEFFTRWGANLSDKAKQIIKGLGYEEETRPIYYFNDEVRRQRLTGKTVTIPSNINITVEKDIEKQNKVPNKVKGYIVIKAENTDISGLIGYEIQRDGKPVGFTKNAEVTAYIDYLTSDYAGKEVNYSVVAIAIDGNKKVVYEGKISIGANDFNSNYREARSISEEDTSFTTKFEDIQPISGILLELKEDQKIPTNGSINIGIKNESGEISTVCKIDLENFLNTLENDQQILVNFKNLEDNQTSIYNISEVSVTGNYENFNISLISDTGQKIALNHTSGNSISNLHSTREVDTINAEKLASVGGVL